jgi:hypothetical protein
MQNITTRLERFHALTAGMNCTVFFLQLSTLTSLKPSVLQSQYASFQSIQLLMIKNNIAIPLIYLPTPESLLEALKVFAATSREQVPCLPVAGVDILSHVSMQTPMSKEVYTGLSDVASNMRELVILAGQRDASDRLTRVGLSEYEIEQFQEFWMDEFVADA